MWYIAPSPHLDTGLPWATRVEAVVASAVLGAAYLHAVMPNVRPGLGRLLLAAPVLAVQLVAPMLFSSTADLLTRISFVFIFAWLGTFKVGLVGGWSWYTAGGQPCTQEGCGHEACQSEEEAGGSVPA